MQILDSAGYNVALSKPVNSSTQFVSANPLNMLTASAGNDGVVDQAVVPLNLVHSADLGTGWWTVDLQVSFETMKSYEAIASGLWTSR